MAQRGPAMVVCISINLGVIMVRNIEVMTTYNGKLYAGLGNNAAGDATVWEYDGSTCKLLADVLGHSLLRTSIPW
jgi:hypothetical protein